MNTSRETLYHIVTNTIVCIRDTLYAEKNKFICSIMQRSLKLQYLYFYPATFTAERSCWAGIFTFRLRWRREVMAARDWHDQCCEPFAGGSTRKWAVDSGKWSRIIINISCLIAYELIVCERLYCLYRTPMLPDICK